MADVDSRAGRPCVEEGRGSHPPLFRGRPAPAPPSRPPVDHTRTHTHARQHGRDARRGAAALRGGARGCAVARQPAPPEPCARTAACDEARAIEAEKKKKKKK